MSIQKTTYITCNAFILSNSEKINVLLLIFTCLNKVPIVIFFFKSLSFADADRIGIYKNVSLLQL